MLQYGKDILELGAMVGRLLPAAADHGPEVTSWQ